VMYDGNDDGWKRKSTYFIDRVCDQRVRVCMKEMDGVRLRGV